MNKLHLVIIYAIVFTGVFGLGCYAWMGAEFCYCGEVNFNRVDAGVALLLTSIITREVMHYYIKFMKMQRKLGE